MSEMTFLEARWFSKKKKKKELFIPHPFAGEVKREKGYMGK